MARIKKFKVGIVQDVYLDEGQPVIKCHTATGIALVEFNDFDLAFVIDRLGKVRDSLLFNKRFENGASRKHGAPQGA